LVDPVTCTSRRVGKIVNAELAIGRADLSLTLGMHGVLLEITIVAATKVYAIVHERKDFEPSRGRGWASIPVGRVLGRLPLDHERAAFRTFRVDPP
jgi:hypothetical protein